MSRSPPRSAGTARSREVPRARAASGSGAVEHDRAGQPPRPGAQPFVGGNGHVGEHLECCRRILREARRRAPARRGGRLPVRRRGTAGAGGPDRCELRCDRGWSGLARGGPRRAGRAFPRGITTIARLATGRPTSAPGPNTASYSSRTTSSGGRVHDSTSRTRPDSETSAASRPTCQSVTTVPRAPAQRAGDAGQVDRAAHRRTDPDVVVLAGAPGEFDDPLAPLVRHVGALLFDDRQLVARRSGSPSRCGTCGRRPPPRCARCRRRRTDSSRRRYGNLMMPRPCPAAARAAHPRTSR